MTGRTEQNKRVIVYSGYYRAEALKCGCCEVVRPLTDFHKDKTTATGYRWSCKRCGREYADKHREHYRQYGRAWQKANRDKMNEYKRRERERSGAAAWKLAKKLEKIKREERLGVSDYKRYTLTREGRALAFSKTLKIKYGIPCTKADCIKEFLDRTDFKRVYAAWKRSGYQQKLSPVVWISPTTKATSISDFSVRSYSYARSKSGKSNWSRNKYANRKNPWITRRASMAKLAAAGNSGQPVSGISPNGSGAAQAESQMGERQVPMEAKGGAL